MATSVSFYLERVKNLLPAAATVVDDTALLSAVNMARRNEIANDFDPIVNYYSWTLQPNQGEYNLSNVIPISRDRILKVFNVAVSLNSLQWQLTRQYKEEIPILNLQGLPNVYYVFSNPNGITVGFYPIPSQSLTATVKLSLLPTELSVGGVDTEIPNSLRDLVIMLSCSYVGYMIGQAEMGLTFKRLYESTKFKIRTHVSG